jgi:hypothetical protein
LEGIILNILEEKVNFPNELLAGMRIESLFVNPIDKTRAVTALSGMEHGQIILRLYHLLKGADQEFFPTHELAAYCFMTMADLKDFVKKLPNMTAIELLISILPDPAASITH